MTITVLPDAADRYWCDVVKKRQDHMVGREDFRNMLRGVQGQEFAVDTRFLGLDGLRESYCIYDGNRLRAIPFRLCGPMVDDGKVHTQPLTKQTHCVEDGYVMLCVHTERQPDGHIPYRSTALGDW